MSDPVLTSATSNTRAAVLVLDQAEKAGLPDPMSVAVARGYDNELSRHTPQIRLQFKSGEDLQAWAAHLGVEVHSKSTIASNYTFRVASVWHHDAIAEWMDVALALTAVTEHPIRGLAVVP